MYRCAWTLIPKRKTLMASSTLPNGNIGESGSGGTTDKLPLSENITLSQLLLHSYMRTSHVSRNISQILEVIGFYDDFSNATIDEETAVISTKGPRIETYGPSAQSYAFLITLLSIAVFMATMFTLFGLFVKAGAHTSNPDTRYGGHLDFAETAGRGSGGGLLSGRFEASLFSDDLGDAGFG